LTNEYLLQKILLLLTCVSLIDIGMFLLIYKYNAVVQWVKTSTH